MTQLWRQLDALVQDGSLLDVELAAHHPECPGFLLSIAANKPPFYVEVFRGDLDVAFEAEEVAEEEVPLCVRMNWLGSDRGPTFWQTALDASEPDFGEVLRHILFMTEDHPADRTTNLPQPI